VWQLIKPINKWHVAAYFIVLSLSVYDQATQPASKVITDYKRIEGVVIKVSRLRGYPVVLLKVDDEIISLSFSGKKYDLYYSWRNKERIVYYWPEHFLNSNNILVLMTTPLQESVDLEHFIKDEDGFNNPSLNRGSKHAVFVTFWVLWLCPFLWEITREERKKRSKENIFTTKINTGIKSDHYYSVINHNVVI
jgi:hypothetical protein